ncbi:hypothetical protein SARC_08896 [Sphaeroforma arctica JP610]|uniref:Uncharacterized protein n=1 Tax=Sphaeroforma arctica JP610 TaxID=667725 RepID=A0A0L0FQ85_9EUKA|nr:hypothetical protein SARC_08896 [Sphaeroforma arctica JP610]KNC78686.1 hypothetical protein SARC_08896 [Sphaeroforma arctica JP610]|eukprot:XP_014152588.1 hypothetical protein SARC_08896 [Sphaeroforma arctica JP610]
MDFPFVYLNGAFCCANSLNNFNEPEPIDVASTSCLNDNFTPCPDGTNCVNGDIESNSDSASDVESSATTDVSEPTDGSREIIDDGGILVTDSVTDTLPTDRVVSAAASDAILVTVGGDVASELGTSDDLFIPTTDVKIEEATDSVESAATDASESTNGSQEIVDSGDILATGAVLDSVADAIPTDGVVSAAASEAVPVSVGSDVASELGASEGIIIPATDAEIGAATEVEESAATDAAEPTDGSREIVEDVSVSVSAEATDAASDGVVPAVVPQQAIGTPCPADFPFAYANGAFCCATGLNNFAQPEPIDITSPSCQGDNFTPCPDETNCVNAFEGAVVPDVVSDVVSVDATDFEVATDVSEPTDGSREIVDVGPSDAVATDGIIEAPVSEAVPVSVAGDVASELGASEGLLVPATDDVQPTDGVSENINAQETDGSREIVENESDAVSVDATDALSGNVEVRNVPCPADFPYAYLNGAYCCGTGLDNASPPAGITFSSESCQNDSFTPCSEGNSCVNNNNVAMVFGTAPLSEFVPATEAIVDTVTDAIEPTADASEIIDTNTVAVEPTAVASEIVEVVQASEPLASALETDARRELVETDSDTVVAAITDTVSDEVVVAPLPVATEPVSEVAVSTPCPVDFPFVYADGAYCCATGLNNFINPEPIDKSSPSCQNNNFTPCPDGTDCVNAFDAEGVVVESVAVDAASEADEVVPATESIPSAQETDAAREIVDAPSDAIITDAVSDEVVVAPLPVATEPVSESSPSCQDNNFTPCPDGTNCENAVGTPIETVPDVLQSDAAPDVVETTTTTFVTNTASVEVIESQTTGTPCPADFPFAYLNGAYCCATGLNNFIEPQPIDSTSPSCQGNNFTPCPNGTDCVNAFS